MSTRKISFIALFVALGIVIPQTLHIFGGPSLGTTLLPMHLPVFIGAMLLGPISGIIIGSLSLLIGVMLGMPPILIAIYMFFELGVYGLVSGYLAHTKKVNVFVSFFTAKVLGMASALFVVRIMITIFHVSFPPIFGTVAMFSAGIPGIIIQIVLVLGLVLLLQKEINKYDLN